ncbi:STAS domain-containing protein [Streptomyces sp. NPDC050743]|uniref:STAS domain-containing protein n=1 Tax=Streptomyces sp. NPDC050743 TaxID=3365634 RepID=UPI0037BBD197
MNTLLAAHRDLVEAGGWLRLVGLTASVMRTVQIVGVDTVIPCYGSLRDALAPWPATVPGPLRGQAHRAAAPPTPGRLSRLCSQPSHSGGSVRACNCCQQR